MRYEDRKELTMKLVNKIKSNGYRVFLHDDGCDFIYGFYTDGDRVASFDYDSLEGYCITSKHKPSREFGSGLGVLHGGSLDEVTKEVLESALGIAPNWFIEEHPRKFRRIKKWTLEEYLADSRKFHIDYKEI